MKRKIPIILSIMLIVSVCILNINNVNAVSNNKEHVVPYSVGFGPSSAPQVPILEIGLDKNGLIRGKKTASFVVNNTEYKIKKVSNGYKVSYKVKSKWKDIPNKSKLSSGYYYIIVKNPDGTKSIQIRIGKVTEKPEAIKIKSIKSNKKGKVTVKFKKQQYVQGYEIKISTSNKFKKSTTKTKFLNSSNNNYTFSRLKSKKTYYVKVRAYKISNGKKLYGSWSKVSKLNKCK